KLDCEGAEWELLRDVAPWQRVQQLTMEYHLADGQTLAQMRALVERAGFTVQVVMPADTFGLLVARR
ncbi:FkbM family methyltransferase, partial [bacterium]|nr:FkbM family methyltransferase [bacterium]